MTVAEWKNLVAKLNLTREELAHACALALQQKAPEIRLKTITGATVEFERNGKPLMLFLENLWRIYKDQPATLIPQIERSVAGILYEAPIATRDNVILTVKDEEFLRAPEPAKGARATRHLAADLWVVYGLDLPDATTFPSAADLYATGVTAQDLHEQALKNVRRLLNEVQAKQFGPVVHLSAGGDYDGALLLMEDVWQQVETQVSGQVLACLPSRNTLFFTSTGLPEGLSQLRSVANDVFSRSHHLVSRTVLRRQKSQWYLVD